MPYSHEERVAKLVETGCDPAQAEAIMRAIDASRDGYVTMDELLPLFEEKLNALRDEFGVELKGDVNTHSAAFSSEMDKCFAKFSSEMDKCFAEFSSRMDKCFAELSSRMDKCFTELSSRMDKCFAEFMGEMRDELHTGLNDIRLEIHRGIWKIVGAIIAAAAAVATIIKVFNALLS